MAQALYREGHFIPLRASEASVAIAYRYPHLKPYNRGVLKVILRRSWIFVLFVIAILLLPSSLLRTWLPRPGTLPTPTAVPTADALTSTYEEALQLAASDPLAALPLLEDVAFSLNPNAESARQLASAIQSARLADDEAYTLTAAGQTLAALGEWELARIAFLRALELTPDYAEAWAYLGEAQQQNGEDGLPALERALDLNPLSLAAQLFNALYWQRQGDFDQADVHYHLASLLAPEDALIQIQWGQNSVLSGNVLDARQHFEHAVELEPDNLAVTWALAIYSLDAEVFVEEIGLPAARRLTTAFTEDAAAWTLLGRAHTLLEHKDVARTFLEHAISLDPSYAPAHLYFALFLLAVDDEGGARTHFDLVIFLAPGSPEAEVASRWIGLTSH